MYEASFTKEKKKKRNNASLSSLSREATDNYDDNYNESSARRTASVSFRSAHPFSNLSTLDPFFF